MQRSLTLILFRSNDDMWPVTFVYQDVIDLNVTKLNRADEDLHVILVEDQSKNKVYNLKQRVPNAFVTRSF